MTFLCLERTPIAPPGEVQAHSQRTQSQLCHGNHSNVYFNLIISYEFISFQGSLLAA